MLNRSGLAPCRYRAAAATILSTIALFLASTAVASFARDKATAAPPSPAIWRISDADSRVYLIGTFAALPTEAPWRSRALAAALDGSEIVWFEAPVGAPPAQAAAARIFETEGKLAPGRALSAQLPAAPCGALGAIAASISMPMESLDALKPWAAFVILSSRVHAADGAPAGDSIDAVLAREAAGRGRDIRYLSTIEETLGVLTGMPEATQIALLVHLIDDWARQREGVGAAFEAWRIGDLAATDAYLNAAMREAAPAVYERLVAARAADLAEDVAGALRLPQTSFIALNAGYLVGDGAIPALLASRGLKVERIDDAAAGGAARPKLRED